MLPGWAPSLELNNSATTFLTYTSAFLSLLLVFRTNASYGRWDEARKMWGLLLNRSRDIMRMGATMIPNDEPETKRALARWTIAVAAALRLHFQPGESTLKEMTGDWLSDKELRALEDAPHKPVMAIHALSQVVMNSKMDSIEKTTLGTNITQYHDILGGCERLLRAPIPVSYTRHTARFLFLWLSFLPFAAYHNLHEFTAPVTMLIAACLLAVEEIGVQCEEPFGVLPLIVIVERVKADVSKTLQDDVNVQKVVMEAMMADKMALSQAGRDPSTLTTKDVPLSAANMRRPCSWRGELGRRQLYREELHALGQDDVGVFEALTQTQRLRLPSSQLAHVHSPDTCHHTPLFRHNFGAWVWTWNVPWSQNAALQVPAFSTSCVVGSDDRWECRNSGYLCYTMYVIQFLGHVYHNNWHSAEQLCYMVFDIKIIGGHLSSLARSRCGNRPPSGDQTHR
eukprot:362342-Chlamydomonas_euryale.AAC.11